MRAEDRRQSLRKVLHVPASLHLPGLAPVELRTLDVGGEGLCAAAAVAVPSNSKCTIVLQLPQPQGAAQRLELPARVVYSVFSTTHGVKIGLHFLSPSAHAQAALNRYVAG
jgi:hypothetical protein